MFTRYLASVSQSLLMRAVPACNMARSVATSRNMAAVNATLPVQV